MLAEIYHAQPLKNPIKQLAGQTVIYGLSSVVGRLLNYVLVPLHVALFQPDAYGVVTELYAYAAFVAVLLVYGMETAFFRFLNKDQLNAKNTFTSGFRALLTTTLVFWAAIYFFQQPVAQAMLYADHPEYVVWFALILGLDALSALPLARLRANQQPVRFAIINLTGIGITILLNVFFLLYCKPLVDAGQGNVLTDWVYNPAIGVGYIFIANLIGSGVRFLLLVPGMLRTGGQFDRQLLRRMLFYGLPLMFFGLAGIVNETADRILLRRILTPMHGETYAQTQVGIYGANYKLAMLITIFIQAFRYAFEPFLFAHEKEKGSKQTYANVMLVFVAATGIIFLLVTLYLNFFKKIILPNEAYWSGLKVVPVLLLANVFLGILYNLGAWFKLTDNTRKGMLIAFFGAFVTVVFNLLLIPEFEYQAAAYTTLLTYFLMVVISYFWGRQYYPIPYPVLKILILISLPVFIYFLTSQLNITSIGLRLFIHTFIFVVYTSIIYFKVIRKIITQYT